jgi:hypothetical protein
MSRVLKSSSSRYVRIASAAPLSYKSLCQELKSRFLPKHSIPLHNCTTIQENVVTVPRMTWEEEKDGEQQGLNSNLRKLAYLKMSVLESLRYPMTVVSSGDMTCRPIPLKLWTKDSVLTEKGCPRLCIGSDGLHDTYGVVGRCGCGRCWTTIKKKYDSYFSVGGQWLDCKPF